ncbi:hypothetical protein AB0D11_21995 [Streptomyces monashensis]|uniref:hypothetical protein n=1 Tax=Streptomyces monashensis TaxID=1678012 RepID=UPI0033FF0CEA
MTGLPYEECKRWREEGRTPPAPESVPPAYALPPFHPYFAERARERRRRRRSVDGATVSGVLTVLCVATLIVTVVVAATLPV